MLARLPSHFLGKTLRHMQGQKLRNDTLKMAGLSVNNIRANEKSCPSNRKRPGTLATIRS